MVRIQRVGSVLAVFAVVTACTSVAPVATPFISTPVTPIPATSGLPSFAVPSLPAVSVPLFSLAPVAPTPGVTPVPPTDTPTPTPTPTPKPTKKPTPTPSPTPTPTPADLELSVAPIADPWYEGDVNKITIYVSALGTQDVPNAHVKVVFKDEGVSESFDTGSIVVGGNYYHEIGVSLPASGPTTMVVTASVPNGYVDTKPSNNKVSVSFTVQAKP